MLDYQCELIKLQNDDKLKMMFKEMDLIQFYKYVQEDDQCDLKTYAQGIL